jgi:hypothetical protein
MMGSTVPTALGSELSVLRALARLLDPEADEEIERIAANLPGEDVRHAVEELAEMMPLIRALTPIEAAVADAIEDLQRREAMLGEREARLRKREDLISRALTGLEKLLGGKTGKIQCPKPPSRNSIKRNMTWSPSLRDVSPPQRTAPTPRAKSASICSKTCAK